MEINFNVGSLKIVYNPLMEYFKKIQNNVSQNLTLIRDEKKVATNHEAVDLLIKAQGTLKMIGLLGLVKVLALNTEALREIKDVKHDTSKSVAILEVVNLTIRNVIVYLENLLNGEQDQPTKFYEQYSQLAELLNKKVSIKDLFVVKLDLKEDVKPELKEELRVGVFTNPINKASILESLNKHHSVLQSQITTMLKLLDSGFDSLESKQQYQNTCKVVYDAVQSIQNLKLSKNIYIVTGLQKLLICISSPIFNDEIIKLIKTEEKDALKIVVAKIERVTSSLIKDINDLDEGDKTSTLKADSEIVSDLLFFIIKALNNNNKLQEMPVLKDLNTYFNFDFYAKLLKSTEISYSLIQRNPELVEKIEQSLLGLKEELTLLTDKDSLPDDFLTQHINKYSVHLSKIHELLNSVAVKDLNNLYNALNTVINKIKSKEIGFNENVQKEVSLSTLLVESSVKTLTESIVSEQSAQKMSSQLLLESKRLLLVAQNKNEELNNAEMPKIDKRTKEKDANEALLSLFDQLGKELEKAEKVLDTYLRTDGENSDELKDVYKPLTSAKGIFTVVKKPNLSKLVSEIQNIWKTIEVSGINSVDKSILQKSIVILSGLTLLINAEKEGNAIESEAIEARLLKNLNIKPEVKTEVKVEIQPEIKTEIEVEVKPEVKTEIKVEVKPKVKVKHETLSTPVNGKLFEDQSNDPDMLEVYLMEAEEVLTNTNNSIAILNNDLSNNNEIANMRRYFHTLKGSGRMIGLIYLGEAAWIVEQTLNKVISGNIMFDDDMLSAITNTKNKFENWVKELQETQKVLVDVLSVKKEFEKFNDHITTIQLGESLTEEVKAPEVKVIEETIPEVKVEETIAFEVEEVTPIEDRIEINELPSVDSLVFETEQEIPAVMEEEKVEEIVYVEESQPEVTAVEQVEESLVFETEQEIPAVMEEEKVEEIVYVEESQPEVTAAVEQVEELPKVHFINGKEIGEELFNMFLDESNKHIKGMKEFLNDEFVEQITNEFIIHAHTLSSISRAVNLNDFAKLVHKIELLSTLAHEKEIILDKMQLRVLKNVVNKLDFYKTTVNGVIIDESLFNEDIALLNELQSDILAEKVVQQITVTQPLEEQLDMKFKETVEESFSEIKESINKLQDEIRTIKQTGGSTVNSEELLNTLMNKVKAKMDEQYDTLNTLIKKNVHDNHEIVNELFSKVDNIENSVSNLDKQQKASDKANRELLESIRKDILGLGEVLQKKKSDGSYLEPFQEELTEESLSGDVIHDVQKVSLNEELLDVLSNVELNKKPEIIQSKASLFIANNEFIKTIFEDTVSNVDDEIDDEIYEISKEESDNMLDKIDSLLENISPVFDIVQNNELKRYLHTLKGSVRMAGANKIGAVAHRLETILDYSENRKISLMTMIDLLEEEINKIKFLLKDPKQLLNKEQMDWLDRKELEIIDNSQVQTISNLDKLEENKVESVIERTTPLVKKEEKQLIRINSEIIDSLINEAGEIRLTRTTLEGMADNEKKSLNELKGSTYKLLKMLKEVEIQAETQIQAGKDKYNEDHTFDPLEFDRYTRLQELTRFMNEIVADIQDTVTDLDGFNKVQNSTISNQASLTNNVLDSLMKVRLVPFSSMNNRLYKVTRETAKELGKKVTLELHGENTEFDRIVLDKIITPIDHLLRNSISHGIEMPEERLSSGKDVSGKIKITTQLEGNFIVISIEDDGAGINVEKIQSIGLKKGLLIPGKDYTKEEIIDLIFHNGFSTADAVSKVAGRGVGMDIVKSDVSALSGSITITTEREKGTKFTIVLPVALATNQAMLSENLGKLVAIPAILVNEVISCKKIVLEEAYEKGFVTSRNKNYKLVYMGHLIGELSANQKPEIKNYNSVVLVNYLNEDLAVHVDKLQTTNEILIKKIGTHLSKVNGLLGVTLLGDGKQGIVVNPVMLEKHFESYIKNKKVDLINHTETQQNIDTISVMVVDDSITVRRITSKILEKNNFHVILAKDGEDALEQLQISTPNIILSDIEMPNMDGFELLKNLKNSEKYKNIPVIMITSRTADKHKNYAFELGVNGFLGKPFNEEELLEKINELLKK